MTTYFAYGSNLLFEQMQDRCSDNKLLGIGILRGYRFLIGERGYATITPGVGFEVEGALFSLSKSDERKLDEKEGVAIGCYRKMEVSIIFGAAERKAIAYVDDRISPGTPFPDYIDKIIRGSIQVGLSEGYRDFLANFTLTR